MRPLFVLLFAVPVLAAPVPKELKKAKPSVNGRWCLTEYIWNGKPANPPWGREWTFDGEKIIIGTSTTPFTFRDPDQPQLRMWSGCSAVVMLVDDKLHFCYTGDSNRQLTDCAPGPGVNFLVFERVKEVSAQALIGKWKGATEGQGAMEFTKDGKYKMTNVKGEVTDEGRYKVEGNKVTIGDVVRHDLTVSKLTETGLVISNIFDGPKQPQRFTRDK